ncbi:hypothetical protein V8C44DRAFT_315836 [Trichoderma aethiopicum]
MFPANHRRGRLRQCWERISGCLGLKYGRSRLFFCGEKIKDKERERERARRRGEKREYRARKRQH